MYVLLSNCIGIPTGRRNLPYCYCSIIVTEHICIFIDCTCIGIVAEDISRIYWDCVDMSTGRVHMLDFSGIEISTGRIGVYF